MVSENNVDFVWIVIMQCRKKSAKFDAKCWIFKSKSNYKRINKIKLKLKSVIMIPQNLLKWMALAEQSKNVIEINCPPKNH